MEEARRRFFEKFVEWLQRHGRDSAVMFIDNRDWKFKHFALVEDLTAESVEAIADAWRYVSFGIGDADKLTAAIIKYASEMKDNEDERYVGLAIPTEGIPSPREWLDKANSLKCSLAIRKEQVTCKPLVLVDIDLKDQEQLLKDGAFIAPGADANYLKGLPAKEKVKLLSSICNLDVLVTETEPMLVLFTGGGFHIWYALDYETDAQRYGQLHGDLCKKIEDLFPGLIVDKAANHITQNIRLPYTYNGKYDPEIACEILYEADEFKTPEWISKIYRQYEVLSQYTGSKPVTVGSPDDYDPAGALDVTSTSAKSKRPGLRNFRRDPRMWDFIQRYLTFEAICAYTKVDIRNGSKHSDPDNPNGYYILCSSPLRKDDNPSFFVFNSGLFCRDKGRQDKEYDFATLMRLLVVKAKERYGFPTSETTRYEADFHCIYAAFLHYMQRSGTGILPMLQATTNPAAKRDGIDTEIDPGNDLGKKKKVIPGKQYYFNLQVTLDTLYKQLQSAKAWTDDYLKNLLANTLDTYYFYDVKQATSGQAFLTNTVALCVIHYFNQLNLAVQFDRPGKFKLYVVNKEQCIHELWMTWITGHTLTGNKDDLSAKTAIQTFIVNSNMADAGTLPKGTPRLCDYVYGILAEMQEMEHELANFLPVNHIPDEGEVREGVIQYLMTRIIQGSRISACDIKLSVLNAEHYIEFDNCLVLYQTDPGSYSRIGITVPRSQKNNLLHKSVVDLRIEHSYFKDMQTPKFDRFVQDMTYDNNCFDKAMMYFLSSLLYSPRTHPGKVWFLLGRDGDNGKSVIGTIVAGLLGDRYTTTKDMADLTATSDRGKNTRYELMHSLLNVTQDSSRNKLEGVFKSLIEGEPVSVRALYQKEYDVCLPTHYMVNANSLPATWGETQPLVKRIILTRVDRVVPKEKRIDNLGNKIVNEEAAGIWPKIIAAAETYLNKGVNGFLTQDELSVLNKTFFDENDVYAFMHDYCFYDPDQSWHVTGKVFKVLYNKYRNYMSKQSVSSDNLISEAASFARKLFQGRIPDSVLDKGFDYRCSEFRGLPIRIYVAPQQVGNYSAIDSEPEGTPAPDASLYNEK